MKGRKGWNFFRFGRSSLLHRQYIYFDRDQCSFSLLRRRNVRMKIKSVLKKQNDKYVVVLCKVRKKDVGEFEVAMEELPNKMLICGYLDYSAFCDQMAAAFEEIRKERERRKTVNVHRGHQEDCGGREGRSGRDGGGTPESAGIERRAERQL